MMIPLAKNFKFKALESNSKISKKIRWIIQKTFAKSQKLNILVYNSMKKFLPLFSDKFGSFSYLALP